MPCFSLFVYFFFLNVIFCERRNLSSLRRDASEKDFESSKDLCLLPRSQEHVLLGYLICAGSSKGDLSKGCFRRPKPSLCLCLARVFFGAFQAFFLLLAFIWIFLLKGGWWLRTAFILRSWLESAPVSLSRWSQKFVPCSQILHLV